MSSEENKNLGNDIVELAKVWKNLSEDMQLLLAKTIGGEEFVEGTKAMIGEIGKFDDTNELRLSLEDFEMLYLTEYDEDEVEEDQGEDVLNFLQWLRDKCSE